MKLKRHIPVLSVLIILLGIGVSLCAQKFDFWNLSTQNGLAQSQVYSMCQDKYNRLWIGTLGGLSCFDGRNFKNYTQKDGLPSNIITKLFCDSKGQIWIGSQTGLTTYDGKSFKNLDVLEFGITKGIKHIMQWDEEHIYFVAANKIFQINDEQISAKRAQHIPDSAIQAIAKYDKQGLLAVDVDATIYIVDQGKTQTISLDKKQELKPKLKFVFIDNNNGIFFVTNDNVYKVQIQGNQYTIVAFGPSNHIVYDFIQDHTNAYWMSTNQGVYQIKDGNTSYYNEKKGFTNKSIICSLQDNEGNVWFGSDGEGVFRFVSNSIHYFDNSSGLSDQIVTAMIQDKLGDIWLGTYDGITKYSNQQFSQVPLPQKLPLSKKISCGIIDNRNNIWFGTLGGGLWLMSNKSFKHFGLQDGLPSLTISALGIDDKDNLWVATTAGLAKYNETGFNVVSKDEAIGSCIASIGKDSLLIGSTQGLWIQHNQQKSNFTKDSLLSNVYILSMAVTQNVVWIGTGGYGLIYYDRVKDTGIILNSSVGFPSDFIYSIHVVSDQEIWTGTGKGINHIVLNKQDNTFKILPVGSINSTFHAEANQNAVLNNTYNNSVWFGTAKGIIILDKTSYSEHSKAPNVYIDQVKVHNVLYDGLIKANNGIPKFHVKDNHFTFHFQGISLTHPADVIYQYQLEGLEESWTDLGTNNSIVFPSIPSGEYTFKVRASIGGAIFSDNAVFPFEIRKAWYANYWAQFLAVLSFIGLGVLIQFIYNRNKLNRLKLIESLRKEEQMRVRQQTSEDFHDELGNKITRISILTEILDSKISKENRDVKSISKQIKENASLLYTGTKDIIWALNPSSDQLTEIINHVALFGDELFQDTNIAFECKIVGDPIATILLSQDYSRNISMICKEALHNALKHAKATEVIITFEFKREASALQVEIADNGIGFEGDQMKKGYGLSNMQQRAKRIKADFQCNQRKPSGTEIKLHLKIPLDRGLAIIK